MVCRQRSLISQMLAASDRGDVMTARNWLARQYGIAVDSRS